MQETAHAPGQEVLLNIQDSARKRVICGLRWDPMDAQGETDTGGLNRAGGAHRGTTSAHDLDLLCLAFDKYGRIVAAVTGDEEGRAGDEGNIYHTGDVIDGSDLLDDEQISVELFNLSSRIHQIVFIAEVQSAHTFAEIKGGEIRIANAIDDRNMAHSWLGKTGSGADKTAFIFGLLYRAPRGWTFRFIGEYLDGQHVEDWSAATAKHLDIAAAMDADGKPAGPVSPAKGQTVPLHYSREARQRVICGLSWDPADGGTAGMADKLKHQGHNIETFDLDLACVMYDADGQAVDGVSAKSDETADASGKVYHTGDDTSGEGGRDDEAISVELKDIPDDIYHIVFLTEIQSLHTFGDIYNPSMRIADGKTEDEQLVTPLNAPAGRDKTAYVFARLTRKGDGWTLHNIDDYVDGAAVEDWIEYLERYLG